jgi:hypothetical protein
MRVWRVRRVSDKIAQIQTKATAMPPPAMGMMLISSVDLCVCVSFYLVLTVSERNTYHRLVPSGLVRDFKNRLKY